MMSGRGRQTSSSRGKEGIGLSIKGQSYPQLPPTRLSILNSLCPCLRRITISIAFSMHAVSRARLYSYLVSQSFLPLRAQACDSSRSNSHSASPESGLHMSCARGAVVEAMLAQAHVIRQLVQLCSATDERMGTCQSWMRGRGRVRAG